ncbi:MAG TPA: DUF2079 domain-containing protein [Candidatus Omnitrophota bacterium]|nr:DUF2079 domain-containing protein [Candidatus Omnitrophota bacterium]
MKALIAYYGLGVVAVFAAAAAALRCGAGRGAVRLRRVTSAVFIAALYIPLAQLGKYFSLHLYADFSHWLSLLHALSVYGLPVSFSHAFFAPGTANYFSVHFVPGIYLLGGAFFLVPSAVTLILLNTVLLFSAAIPLYKLARVMLKDRILTRAVVALLLWYPTFQYTVLYEFEMLRFCIPVFLWMLYAWEARKNLLYWVMVAAAVLVREEVGLTVFFFGLYASIWSRRRLTGIATALAGLGGFLIITRLVMPAFRAGEYAHIAMGSFSGMGTSMADVAGYMVSHPAQTLVRMLGGVKLMNIAMFFVPLAGAPLFALSALVPFLPQAAIGLLSESTVHSSYMLYYLSPGIAFIIYASIKAFPRLVLSVRRWQRGDASLKKTSYALAFSLLAAVITAGVFFGPSPLSLQFWFARVRPAPFRTQNFHYSAYAVTGHHLAVNRFVERIPENAIVSTQQFLAPRLYRQKGVMLFPMLTSKDGAYTADYILFDSTNNGLSSRSPAFIDESEFASIAADTRQWKQVATDGAYYLYERAGN